ncbi:site-specific integrase [uncultured Azohydromonas sp.]|jgi:Site-specific recombinase XerD|uniref:site-specific integrase n=1 Tax=uncultured Azohydromonas sp. TaxID=487342 RepID=UPI002625816B|nr:site-specific integrase [uncultured Azohydromonas sp.]
MRRTRHTPATANELPDAAALAALRAWHEGLPTRAAVEQYLPQSLGDGASARGVLGDIRRQLQHLARARQRPDLAQVFDVEHRGDAAHARAVARAIEILRELPPAQPLIGDRVEHWLSVRVAAALKAAGIDTLAALTLRVPRRRRWWATIPGLGAAGARQVEAFFATHPELTERARALVVVRTTDVQPWEHIVVPQDLDGSLGRFRAPRQSCALDARDDYAAVQAWLDRHEAQATQRAYRKEAERLILWSVLERGKALSSLAVEDASAYRAFLRRPAPVARWVGPPRPRHSAEWRPFAGALSARSIKYTLSVLGALFRWLVEQHYVLANPFAGLKVRGASTIAPLDVGRGFSQPEWRLLRVIADGLEWSYGWSAPAGQRLRFVLDFAYATGLRASELVGATLGAIETDARQESWLHLVGKGAKAGKVALPPLALTALERYLVQRGLPVTPARWAPDTPLVGRLANEASGGITATRLWALMRRFFATAASVIEGDNPQLAEKLRRASPHWTRHTHATHALERGAELTTVRDNLRHASIATTSTYLHGDDTKRAREMAEAFGVPPP